MLTKGSSVCQFESKFGLFVPSILWKKVLSKLPEPVKAPVLAVLVLYPETSCYISDPSQGLDGFDWKCGIFYYILQSSQFSWGNPWNSLISWWIFHISRSVPGADLRSQAGVPSLRGAVVVKRDPAWVLVDHSWPIQKCIISYMCISYISVQVIHS